MCVCSHRVVQGDYIRAQFLSDGRIARSTRGLRLFTFACFPGTSANLLFDTVLLSHREIFVKVKFFDPAISMITDISELPESEYELSVCLYACVCVCVCVCACVRVCGCEKTKIIFFGPGFGYWRQIVSFSERP